jgi:DamX protein
MEDALNDLFNNDTSKVAQLELPEPKKPVAAKPVIETIKTDEDIPPPEPVEATTVTEQTQTAVAESKETKAPPEPQQQQTTRPINKFIHNGTATTVPEETAPASKPLDTTVAEKAKQSEAPETKPRPVIKPVLRTEDAAKVETEPKAVPAKPVSAKPVTAIKAKAKPDWLAAQNKNHFTLQLMGSRNKTSVEGYRRSNKLGKEAAVIKTLHQGGEWYVLVYGSYVTKEKARAAIPKLPTNLRKASPWPRKIGDLRP